MIVSYLNVFDINKVLVRIPPVEHFHELLDLFLIFERELVLLDDLTIGFGTVVSIDEDVFVFVWFVEHLILGLFEGEVNWFPLALFELVDCVMKLVLNDRLLAPHVFIIIPQII